VSHLPISPITKNDGPFRTHYVLQGCYSPLSVFFVQRALQDMLHASRVPLASFCFICTTCPSRHTMCSNGATCLLTEFGRRQTPGVNNIPGDIVGD
jgi:hypothetical protein